MLPARTYHASRFAGAQSLSAQSRSPLSRKCRRCQRASTQSRIACDRISHRTTSRPMRGSSRGLRHQRVCPSFPFHPQHLTRRSTPFALLTGRPAMRLRVAETQLAPNQPSPLSVHGANLPGSGAPSTRSRSRTICTVRIALVYCSCNFTISQSWHGSENNLPCPHPTSLRT